MSESANPLVTIFGGAGFLGRHVARRLARQGWRVRVAGRRPNESMHVKPYGAPGQVEPVFCNIRDDDSVRAALRGADAVVNCVGILAEYKRQTFDAVQHEGAARIARLTAGEGIARLVHVSSIGADAESESQYQTSKALGEAAMAEHFPGVVVLRPSVMFGDGDAFFNKIAGLSRFSPVLPLISANTKFQPVFVDDVARAVEKSVCENVAPGVYELGGPDVMTLRAATELALKIAHRKRVLVPMPGFASRIMARALDITEKVSLGIVPNVVISPDQLRSLASDNTVAGGAKVFADLAITPVAAEAVLPDYLWRFRPSGQYDDIRDSAANLRG